MRHRQLITILVAVIALFESSAFALVDLQWRPSVKIAHVGETVDLGLYLVSDSGTNWPVSAMDAVIIHTPASLQFVQQIQSPGLWLSDGFRSGDADSLNKDLYDGEMLYTAWANLGQAVNASPAGLLGTTLRFNAKAVTSVTTVSLPKTYGKYSKTVIYDGGGIPNLDVTGVRGTARVMIVPQNVTIVSSIPTLKQLSNETPVALTGPVVTRSYGSFFYIEAKDRSSAIRVNSTTPVAQGTSPFVQGVLRTIAGERVIDNASVGEGSTTLIPGALAMNCQSLATGLNPSGLLVKLSGRVQDSSAGSTVVISDGSAQDVRVELYGVAAPAAGSYIAVTGALGADTSGPVLRVNNTSDIQIFQQ